MKRIITISGPIGIGKTTITSLLKQNKNIVVIDELGAISITMKRIIEATYSNDLTIDVLAVQLYTTTDRLINYEYILNSYAEGVFVFDRSFIDALIFSKLRLDADDFKLVLSLTKTMIARINTDDSEHVWINLIADDEIVFSRIKQRNRTNEKLDQSTLQFVTEWRRVYDEIAKLLNIKPVYINANGTTEEILNQLKKYLNKKIN